MTRTTWPLGAYASSGAAHYLFLEPGGAVDVVRPLNEAPLPAMSTSFPAFSWDEREMADEYAVRFLALPDARPFHEHDGSMPSAVVANGVGLMQVVVGPVHAGIIEPGRFTFSSGGETVAHLDAQLGYANRGVERALEGVSALEAPARIARICGSCSAARSHAYALALERLSGVSVPHDSELARLIVCEVERIWNHLADIAASASAAGWAPGFANGMALKERAMRLCALATGHRLGFDAIVPGGVGPGTLPDPAAVAAALDELRGDVQRYLDRVFGNASVVSRWQHAGLVTHDLARAFAAVGPPRRAIGDALDVRSFAPYGAYAGRAAAPAVHGGGDALARCSVKRAELAASFELARDALRELGAITPKTVGQFEAVAQGAVIGVVEGPRGAETVAVHVDETGCIRRFHAISASYRNWPIVARAMDGNIIPDFPLVNKSFNLCYACVDR